MPHGTSTGEPVGDVQVEAFDDHVILRPPNRLKERAAKPNDAGDVWQVDPVRRAENALELLSKEFETWINDEIDFLEKARELAAASREVADFASLYRAAHDIRGQAATLGFPLAGEVAEGLCVLMDRASPRPPSQLLVDRHVEAIRAIVREDARDRENPIGVALVRRLNEMRETLSIYDE